MSRLSTAPSILRKIVVLALGASVATSTAQQVSPMHAGTPAERQARRVALERERASRVEAWGRTTGAKIVHIDAQGNHSRVVDIQDGRPIYDGDANENSAISSNVHRVREKAPWNVIGTGVRVGLWETGQPLAGHVEYAVGAITNADGSTAITDHSCHVACTILGQGIDPVAAGMAPGALIQANDFVNAVAEITAQGSASPLDPALISLSNHSWGNKPGWDTVTDPPGPPPGTYPEWRGVWGEAEDRNFGMYDTQAVAWDSALIDTPYHLVIKAAMNERNDNAPAPGTNFVYYVNGVLNMKNYIAGVDPAGDGANGGYDTIPTHATSKNVLTVGAVNDATGDGVTRNTALATPTSFTGYGPTDDGRLKPDLVANGQSLWSAVSTSTNAYGSMSGTSMATPTVTGGAALLTDYFRKRFPGSDMRATTLKALLLHSATDLGLPGPDYQTGYGLMDVYAAARMIQAFANSPNSHIMREDSLSTANDVDDFTFVWDGHSEIKVTLVWADPPGTAVNALDSTTPNLVNDLDLRVYAPGFVSTYVPYVLNPLAPAAAATQGDNVLDNVEQVRIPNPTVGGQYTIRVFRAGALANGFQRYSLITTGQNVGTLGLNPQIADNLKLKLKNGSGGKNQLGVKASLALGNTTPDPLTFTLDTDQPWLKLVPENDRLEPGETLQASLVLNSEALNELPGRKSTTVVLSSSEGTTFGIDLDLEVECATLPFHEPFSTGPQLEAYWSVTDGVDSRARVTTAHGPLAGTMHLVLDDSNPSQTIEQEFDSSTSATESSLPARNEVTLQVDLAGHENLILSFQAKSLGNLPDGPPSIPFTGSADFDGVAVSTDGTTWYEVQELRTVGTSWTNYTVDLSAAMATHGLEPSRPTYIRFNQYGDDPAPFQGLALDEISITGDRKVFTATSSGAWSNPSTWTPNGVPGTGAVVNIGTQVHLTAPAEAHTVNVTPGGILKLGASTLTIGNGGTIDVDGSTAQLLPEGGQIELEGNATAETEESLLSQASVKTYGALTLDSSIVSGSLHLAGLAHVETGPSILTVLDDVIVEDQAELVLSPGSGLEVEGDVITSDDATLETSGGSLEFTGTTSSTLALVSPVQFGTVTVPAGKLVASPDDNAHADTVINNGIVRNTHSVLTTGTLGFGLTGVVMEVQDAGSLTEITIDRVDTTHPNAGPEQQTGKYWDIQGDGTGFLVDLTLPHNLGAGHGAAHISRHLGGGVWDSGRASSDNDFVTRTNVTQFSAWTVSDGPLSSVDNWSMY